MCKLSGGELMRGSSKRLLLIVIISILIGASATYGGMHWFAKGTQGDSAQTEENGGFTAQLEKVEMAYDLIESKFYQEVDKQELVEGAVQGMLETLDDPYSVYMDAKTASQFKDTLNSSFEGIGAEVTMMEGKIIIVAPFNDSPAEEAGLKPNDQLIKIDGEVVEGLDLYEATLKIRGEKGTKVNLEIKREGVSNPIKVSVKRDEIPVETVIANVKKAGDKNVGYIQITTFSENTAEDFIKEVKNLESKNIEGLVIDVRGNPGGLLDSVEKILGELVTDDKPVVQIQQRDGEVLTSFSQNQERKPYPITVLIDEGSASASEILAGALQEAERYPLIGTKSFGKGTVQQAVPMGDGSNIKLTMFKWLTPDGNWIHKKGIKPDIPVQQPSFFYTHPIHVEKPLKIEMNDDQIKNAQEMLQGLGYKPGRTDGYFSSDTERAVKEFQKDTKLDATGVINTETALKLEDEIRSAIKNESNDKQLQTALDYLSRLKFD